MATLFRGKITPGVMGSVRELIDKMNTPHLMWDIRYWDVRDGSFEPSPFGPSPSGSRGRAQLVGEQKREEEFGMGLEPRVRWKGRTAATRALGVCREQKVNFLKGRKLHDEKRR